jgi:hypothetical protein
MEQPDMPQRIRLSPSDRLRRGELGAPLYVLSLPEVRVAEILTSDTSFQTADGDVIGRAGDIAITAYGGERYPIPGKVFYGAYEIIGQVGDRLVARRLIHVRTAWPIISEDAEYDYGPDRGLVSVSRDGWLYQSDDSDFGVINPEQKLRGHVEVGDVLEVSRVAWHRRFAVTASFLIALPPVLTALALLSLDLSYGTEARWVPTALALFETILLLAGVGIILLMRWNHWALKAAMSAGVEVAVQFQAAAELLGEDSSREFAQMALWRAAQNPCQPGNSMPCHSADSAAKVAKVREQLGRTLVDIECKVAYGRAMEHWATVAELAAIVIVILTNIWLITVTHVVILKLFAIWLPSVIGAFHAISYHRRTSDRIPVLSEFLRQLAFVKSQLQMLYAPNCADSPEISRAREAALRLLCKVVGQYCQQELQLAMAQRPNMPV